MKKSPPHAGKETPTSAFTLLEVLVCLAILVVLIILLVGRSDGGSRIWHTVEGKHEIVPEASAGLQMITKDLHSAVITSDPATLSISVEEHEKHEKNGERIFFLVSQTQEKRDSDNNGDLCATGYFVSTDPRDGSRNLYRFQVSGREAEEACESGHLDELYRTASPENTNTTELLARHIIELDVHRLTEFPDLLLISLSAIDGKTERSIDSEPQAKARNERLIRERLQRYTTFVRLPPVRQFVAAP